MGLFSNDSDGGDGGDKKSFRERVEEVREERKAEREAKQEDQDTSSGILGSLKQGVDGVRLQAQLAKIDSTEEEVREVTKQAEHESVTPLRVAKVIEHLEKDEQPEYAIAGGTQWGLRIEGGDESIRQGGMGPASAMNNPGFNILTITDRRVIFLAPQATGDDVHSVPFDVIHGVDTANGMPEKIIVQTTGRTYHMEVSPNGAKERVATEIRKRSRKARQEGSTSSATDGNQGPDPLDQLERLNELREQGALSDEEFQEKKSDLLDEI